jgi:RimJ/RimL family protein N-acetyltransferase
LESELGLVKSSRTISEELKEALDKTILPNVAMQDRNYLFSTLWIVISKEKNKMVASLCFYGEPDEHGNIEVGYGTHEEFRKQGYMTEALGAMIGWAERQPVVSSILASTEKTNQASFSVLQKNGFIKMRETEIIYNWKRKIKSTKSNRKQNKEEN